MAALVGFRNLGLQLDGWKPNHKVTTVLLCQRFVAKGSLMGKVDGMRCLLWKWVWLGDSWIRPYWRNKCRWWPFSKSFFEKNEHVLLKVAIFDRFGGYIFDSGPPSTINWTLGFQWPPLIKGTVGKPIEPLGDLPTADFKRWLLWIANQCNFGVSRGPFGRNCW